MDENTEPDFVGKRLERDMTEHERALDVIEYVARQEDQRGAKGRGASLRRAGRYLVAQSKQRERYGAALLEIDRMDNTFKSEGDALDDIYAIVHAALADE